MQCFPRFAKVAYASAMERGVTSAVPRTNEGLFCSLRRSVPIDALTPTFFAMSMDLQMPTSRISCVKYVLTEFWVPCIMSIIP